MVRSWFVDSGTESYTSLAVSREIQAPVSTKATGAFARRGVRNLLISKFVVGFVAVAAPLAGAMFCLVRHLRSPRIHLKLGRKFAHWHRFVRVFTLARITPEQLRGKLNAGEDILLLDLQGRLGASTKRLAIPGAVRIDPAGLTIQGCRNIALSAGCPLIVRVRVNSRALVSRPHCGRRGSKPSGRSPADFRYGVIAVSPVTTEIQIPVTPLVRS